VPSFGQPKCRLSITTIIDELNIFAIGDQAVGNLKTLQEMSMTGHFAVKAKTVAIMANPVHAFLEGNPGYFRYVLT
jgi:hypothetical protein